MLSVLLDGPAGRLLVTKGEFPAVIAACAKVATPQGERPVAEVKDEVEARFAELVAAGYRVIAVAEAALADRETITPADEQGLTLQGFLTFTDPLRAGLPQTLADFESLGIQLCVLSGDNRLAVAHAVAVALGRDNPRVITGRELEDLSEQALDESIKDTDAFAELTPAHKERILEAFHRRKAVVGYLGDGINDASSLYRADVGISVDSAVDVAKSASAILLLDKDLAAVIEGVRLGRQTFANTLKYIYTTISANFGNTLSMALAAAFLPFLPLLPRQILVLNFLSDLPSLTISADNVDPETLARPLQWNHREVTSFMIRFGLLSSLFDLVTFGVLLQIFHADASLFQTGWFVGSTLTEIAVLLVLRTRRRAYRSRPGKGLLLASIAVGAITLPLPYISQIAGPLGLVPLPLPVVGALLTITLAYVLAAETLKWSKFGKLSHSPRST